METKNYCHKCDTNRTGKPMKIECEICNNIFTTTHRPFDVICPECTEKMNNDGVYRCRVCREKIDSADSEILSEEKDMTRAYRRDKNQEKKKKDMQIKQRKKNQKYISDDDVDDYYFNNKSQSRKNSRHQDKQNINRGLREGFTYDDLDDMVGGKIKFNKNKRNF